MNPRRQQSARKSAAVTHACPTCGKQVRPSNWLKHDAKYHREPV